MVAMVRINPQPGRLRIASIASIVAGTGFSDLSSFNRQFRRIAGKTPSAYRR
jgi:AraC family transcriptional regulator